MSETPDRLELILKRQSSLGRQMEALTESVHSLSRLFEAQFRDLNRRMGGVEHTVRAYASEQITMANQLLDAHQRAEQAHRRLDEAEAG